MDLVHPSRINTPNLPAQHHHHQTKNKRKNVYYNTSLPPSLRFVYSFAAVSTSTETPSGSSRSEGKALRFAQSSTAMDQLDIERGVCMPFRKYTPDTVRNKVLGSRGAILSLVSRGVEIVWNLGFYWSTLVYDFLIGRDEEVVPYRARQLRNLLCDLGPSFIKAGQVLANRPDIIREDYMNELCILQDDVPPFPNQVKVKLCIVAFNIIEEELGQPLEAVFRKISSRTIAAASLGQVYRATLRDSGEDVAIKEAQNIEDFLENFKDDPTVKIPRVYKQLSGQRVLVMEWIDGIRCTDPQAIKAAGIDVNGFLTVGVSAALRQLLEFGLFHGDPHPGNIFAMRDGRIAYVDFGNVAVLSQLNKEILIDAVVHAVNEDYAEMANDFTRLGFLARGTDVAPLIPALEAIWQNSVGKGLSDFNFRSVTGKFNQMVYNYPIRIPERFSLVIRSLLTQEGICLMLEPDFKFLEVAYPYVAKRLLTDPNPALRERLIQVSSKPFSPRKHVQVTFATYALPFFDNIYFIFQVLFKDGVFQWKRLENLIVLAKENVSKMSSNPAYQVKNMSVRQSSRNLQFEKKLDLTDTIKDGARLFLLDEGIRRKLLLAFTEDSKLHIELVDVYRLVEGDLDMPSLAMEVVRGEEPDSKEETNSKGIWRCSICTYDNDEFMSACDICGVLRNPLVAGIRDKKAADGICKDYGVSIMAKSLFASLPHQTPKKALPCQQQNDDLATEMGNNFHKPPFKFDVPSPDDLVSNGMGSKGTLLFFEIKYFPTRATEKNGAVNLQSSAIRPYISSASMSKSKLNTVEGKNSLNSNSVDSPSDSRNPHDSAGESNHLKGGRVNKQSTEKRPDSSSALTSRGKHDTMDESSSLLNGDKPHFLTNNLNDMSLTIKSKNSDKLTTRKDNSNTLYKPEKWMLPDKAEDTLTQLNLAIVGHVDSGKSTLSGRLLHLLGRISQKQMHKYEKEAKLQGKGSFSYAWALDESAEERERGITMTVAVAYFDTKKFHVVLLDSPGHQDFVPNMISGATQADVSIIAIDASVGSFEAGLDSTKGQTREHAQLIRSFGVDQIIVAVNKMDAVAYSQNRFNLIKTQLGAILRSFNYKDSSVVWIPLSAMENQNLVAPPSDVRLSSWYRGPYLLDAIDSLQPPTREFSKPPIMPICDIIKSPSSIGQVSACGKLETGALRSGMKVLVMPFGDVGTVRSLERDSRACAIARAGDNVCVCLQGIDGSHVMAGGVLCHPDFPVAFAKHLELKVVVLDVTIPILVGSELEFHINHAKVVARVVKLLSILDSKTGKVIKKAPRCLMSKQNAVIEVMLNAPVCVEEFSNCKALGRVSLRSLGRTVALGIVSRIIEEQQQ
ncbi:LOW QUALITY PROTEIN: GTP_EFTU domain-containing protein/ABC1 domain-containing protein/GTP_EFTU_D3 domain-containing protein/GTP_EFTU_D2 domain-containing protein [Cephalotus follicularis]|uniref:GTP_EFTU domain-containing protein/ABC1 domain-containing protein/GTP_EFTU_D3 domain-containing protein/GTP_EFTU_D2 domain-containing protein n=1 Tax=Cephalotus follicularis TaxID=3775 RepID=A0A1Q3CCU6_CEPFO|nr:LOW QUALITY PROTEIN: GTP_EFTU domain-containing protein/ABC1 domain-containing protein/GTP_EFTU_D3 domain-containing protein/GTP_EFTU_D2 domain-containing protein [Cephalotus follicularis]